MMLRPTETDWQRRLSLLNYIMVHLHPFPLNAGQMIPLLEMQRSLWIPGTVTFKLAQNTYYVWTTYGMAYKCTHKHLQEGQVHPPKADEMLTYPAVPNADAYSLMLHCNVMLSCAALSHTTWQCYAKQHWYHTTAINSPAAVLTAPMPPEPMSTSWTSKVMWSNAGNVAPQGTLKAPASPSVPAASVPPSDTCLATHQSGHTECVPERLIEQMW